MGNDMTCTLQGLINTFSSIAILFYYCGLTGYFLIAIKTETSDENIQKYYEPIVHFISISYALFASIFVVSRDSIYTAQNICWIAPKPYLCDKDTSGEVECTSGADFKLLRWVFLGGPISLCFCIITTNMLIILRALYMQEQNSNRVSVGGTSASIPRHITSSGGGAGGAGGSSSSPADMESGQNSNETNVQTNVTTTIPTTTPTTTNTTTTTTNINRGPTFAEMYAAQKKKNRKKSKASRDRREGMKQALLYIFAFFLCYFFVTVYVTLEQQAKIIPHDSLLIISKILYPLQGAVNFLIFIRPRIVNALNQQQQSTNTTFLRACIVAVMSKGDATKSLQRRTQQTHHHTNSGITPSNKRQRRSSSRFSMILSSDIEALKNDDKAIQYEQQRI